MTKAQTIILAKAETQPVVSAEMVGGRGSQGGRISFGRREYTAITSLIAAGKLELVNTHRAMSSSGNGYSTHHYIVRAKLA